MAKSVRPSSATCNGLSWKRVAIASGQDVGGVESKSAFVLERTLSAAISSPDPDEYRVEIGAIGQWFVHDNANIDPNWLLDQLLRMLKAGFAPNHPFSAIEWLGKIAHSQPDKAAEVLSELLNNSRAEYSAYATHQSSIRTILECGLMAGTPDTAQRVRDTISVLATRAETSYLNLLRPLSDLEH